ncbi:hypothetical protein [Tahibacter amnicola]|uniref:Uncharacterized protein n=1 Tax=Tahibacter amnicola TaxID=2976241 RepID=A0ABY6B9E8_9GAMM|nr:hypothetical protein [Tahibacter amnicola]UXI66172.1 hypothetical protein N4264_15595 [Tahibacter amnicola]
MAWSGGNAVQLLDVDSGTCTAQSFPGGPAAVSSGTFGRFRCAPRPGVYVVCNRIDDNCYILRLSDRIYGNGFEAWNGA